MPQTVTLYHNPRCSKSRAALALLQERSASVEVIDYQKNPADLSTLAAIARQLDGPVSDMVRMKDAQQLPGGRKYLPDDDDAWLKLLVAYPALLERPILIADARAIIGRPTERVPEFLDSLTS